MGRRAKNKQGAPAPYADETEQKPSAKKLGKRKAEDESEDGDEGGGDAAGGGPAFGGPALAEDGGQDADGARPRPAKQLRTESAMDVSQSQAGGEEDPRPAPDV